MQPTFKLFAAAAPFITAMALSTAANASIFSVDYHDQGVWNAYDSENEAYGMKFRSDQGKDGFWLVVTPGGGPKGDGNSSAILYGDIKNNRITAYTYNGENSSNSYEDGVFLGSYEGVFSSGGSHSKYGYDMSMFSLDVSDINNALGEDFTGVALGDQAGIWFHQSAGSDFTYNEDGSIADYVFDSQMFLDREYKATTGARGTVNCSTELVTGSTPDYLNSCGSVQVTGGLAGAGNGNNTSGGGSVPTPGGLALILVGFAALGRKFRRASV